MTSFPVNSMPPFLPETLTNVTVKCGDSTDGIAHHRAHLPMLSGYGDSGPFSGDSCEVWTEGRGGCQLTSQQDSGT